ncbi:polysaccharide deacetylase family protein [Lentzea tibetensis]|uniref:polysaccharide deacetylase family protein n=1 Tax=Lentzea tibetensis TaxID=2591470 RepID=UPI001F2A3E47|nr:polysaccharide deacetylase family protein [Lentzea tibetensis]
MAILVSCAREPEPRAPVLTTAPPTTTTTTSAPPPVMFPPPYAYGTVQATAPPITGGLVPVVNRIATDKPYVFITIDDGAIKHPAAAEMMRKAGIRPSLFLNTKYIEGQRDYFKALPVTVHSHTSTHPNLSGKGYDFQKNEICGNADFITGEYGKRPTLFRPPFGNHDNTTRKAAADCGFKALVMWTAAVNDGRVQFQAGDKLNRGDIVLMHFRTTFAEDFQAFLDRAKADGLTPVPLEDFLA